MIDSADAENSISSTEEKTSSLATKFGEGIKTAAKWGAAIAAGATAAATGLFKLATDAASTTDTIDKMSQKIGISREAYQELDFVLSQSGTDVSVLQSGIKTLTNQMESAADGGATATAAFESLGLSIYDSAGNLKDQETMMFEAMEALQGMEDQTMKSALAVDIFGKAGTELMPLLNGEAGSIEEMREQAHELGLVMSDEAVDAGVAFTDTMDQLKRSFSAVVTSVGVDVMPIFKELAGWVVDHMPEIQAIFSEVFAVISDLVSNFIALFRAAITAIMDWAENNQEQIQKIKDTFELFFKFVEQLFDAFSAVFTGDWDALFKETLPELLEAGGKLLLNVLDLALDALVALISGAGEAMKNAGKALFTALWDGLKDVWNSITSWVSDKISWLGDKLTFWKISTDEMSVSSNSHASGLAYVPYDNYKANLHKGESVLNANDTQTLLDGMKALISEGVNGMSANQSAWPATIVLQTEDKQTIARAFLPDIRAVMKSSPEVTDDT